MANKQCITPRKHNLWFFHFDFCADKTKEIQHGELVMCWQAYFVIFGQPGCFHSLCQVTVSELFHCCSFIITSRKETCINLPIYSSHSLQVEFVFVFEAPAYAVLKVALQIDFSLICLWQDFFQVQLQG